MACIKTHLESRNYRVAQQLLFSLEPSTDALWLQTLLALLRGNTERAHSLVEDLVLAIDTQQQTLLVATERAWVLQYALLVAFTLPKGLDFFIDLVLSSPTAPRAYLSAMQTICPWMFTHLACALICARRGKAAIKEYIKITAHEESVALKNSNIESATSTLANININSHVDTKNSHIASFETSEPFSDPFNQFLHALFVTFDFENAQKSLRESLVIVKSNKMFSSHSETFQNQAQSLIFDTYGRIYGTVTFARLSELFQVSASEAKSFVCVIIGKRSEQLAITEVHFTLILGWAWMCLEKTGG